MAVVFTRAQRDAVREEIVTDLTGLGDFAGFFDAGDLAKAHEYRSRFEDGLRLLDDLGWESDDQREEFEITLAPDQLNRALRRLQDNAIESLSSLVQDASDDRALAERAAVACKAYRQALAEIERPRR